ncbi:hypothetical protein [Provencibacterium massiliense]|uniref:hypothetical protein n=1 Tax=Provencibacterium massiliense TaxID=1841868 RepID=UPI001FA8AAB4|nr:hypothetical protein [Provencibacterium massiliense]
MGEPYQGVPPKRRGAACLFALSTFVEGANFSARAGNFFKKTLTFVATYHIILLSLRKEGNHISEQKKMGRPTNNPKSTMFRVRLDDESIKKLEESAEALSTTKSDVVREGIDLVYKSLKK